MYGNSVVMNGAAPTQIIENVELLKLHQQNISNGSMQMSNSHINGSLPAPTKQVVNGFVSFSFIIIAQAHCKNPFVYNIHEAI